MANTISDIAKRAGVSPATVSRVINGSGYVSEKNRELVNAVARELNYTKKIYKKRTAANPHNSTIGVVVPDIQNPYYTNITRSITEVMFARGYDVFLCDTDEDSNKEIRSLSALRNNQVCGLIISPVSDVVEYNAEYLRDINGSGIPVVLMDRDLKSGGLDGVFLNNYEGAYSATQAFIDCGHTQIAILCGPTTSKTGLERLNGYFGALRDNNIPVQEEYVLYGDFKTHSAYELTRKLVKTRRRVSAILAANNAMAEGCLRALCESHMNIPKDIALISYGKLNTIKADGLNISYVSQPMHLIAVECAKILLERIDRGKKNKKMPAKRISFSTELVLQGSEKYHPNPKAIP